MSTREKDVVKKFYDVMNAGDVGRFDEVCSPDLKGHAGAGANLVQLKMSVGSFLEAFPDLDTEIRYLIQEDGLVSSWVTYIGTHKEEFAGVPATGRGIKIAGWDLFRIEDGRIVEITQYCDLFTLMNQIGPLPTAAPA